MKDLYLTILTCFIVSMGWAQEKVDTSIMQTVSPTYHHTFLGDTTHTDGIFTVSGNPIPNYGFSVSSAGIFTANDIALSYYYKTIVLFKTEKPNIKTGRTIIHIHKSQLMWLNDSTAVVRPYKKSLTKKAILISR